MYYNMKMLLSMRCQRVEDVWSLLLQVQKTVPW